MNGKGYNYGYAAPLFYSLEYQSVSAMQRRKGASAERELFGLLRDELGLMVERNLAQTRNGGADSVSIPGLSIEVKRQEKAFAEAWWRQACEQAGSDTPVLAYRRSRQPWRFVLPLEWVTGQWSPNLRNSLRCEVGLREFCYLAREKVPEIASKATESASTAFSKERHPDAAGRV